jgi:hypothetical protein
MLRPVLGIARGWVGTANNTASTTSLSIDITNAVVAEHVYAWCTWRSGMSAQAITGWTALGTLQAFGGGSAAGNMQLFRRRKVSGDTTFSLTWTTAAQAEVMLCQWTGLHATTPEEQYTTQANTSAANVFTTPAATPTGTDRWGVGYFAGGSGESAHKQITWTPSAPVTEYNYVYNPNTLTEWVASDVCDTSGPVAVTSTTYTNTSATGGVAVGNGITAIMFLIPAQPAFESATTLQAVNRAAVI